MLYHFLLLLLLLVSSILLIHDDLFLLAVDDILFMTRVVRLRFVVIGLVCNNMRRVSLFVFSSASRRKVTQKIIECYFIKILKNRLPFNAYIFYFLS